jgi:hypothetical protein
MGFIPIFITLAGFVFLFVMLVNQNLNSKRKAYFLNVEVLKKMVVNAYPTVPITGKIELKRLEQKYREAKKQEMSKKGDELDKQIDAQLAACKMARFQYQQLKDTKPYYFAAKLFGHRDI